MPKQNLQPRIREAGGFSLVDVMLTCAIIGIAAAVATPSIQSGLDNMRLGISLRDVERELQNARLKAVSTSRPMRVRFDCPSSGQMRVVELIGSPASIDSAKDVDSNAGRCSEVSYPYRPGGTDRLTRPGNDGPVRYLYPGASFTASQTLEFWADGSVHTACQIAPCNVSNTRIPPNTIITVSRKGISKNIRVNGLGKIDMDR